jgi:hypothetical protein
MPTERGLGRNLWKTSWSDFGPRVDGAYRAADSLVVRSGFEINYLPTNAGPFGASVVSPVSARAVA